MQWKRAGPGRRSGCDPPEAGRADGRLRRGVHRVLRCCGEHRKAREMPDGTTVRLGRPVGVWLGFARWNSEPPQRPATSRVPKR